MARAAPAEKLCRASETLAQAELCTGAGQQLQLQTLSQEQHLALGHGSVSLDGTGLLGRENKFLRKREDFFPSGVK